MTPVMQEFMHNPPETYGDCHRASVASVLNYGLHDVPHFMYGLGPEDGEEFERRQREWLATINLLPVSIPFVGDDGIELVFNFMKIRNPGVYYLIGGEVAPRVGHTVVGFEDAIIHDPHPRKCGLKGPMDDGYFWVTFFAAKL